MASWLELLTRLERVIHRGAGYHCEAVDRATPLPLWLADPWADAQRHAGTRTPLVCLNVRGRATDEALCLLRLGDLENLIAAAQALTEIVGPERMEQLAEPSLRGAVVADVTAKLWPEPAGLNGGSHGRHRPGENRCDFSPGGKRVPAGHP